MRKIIFYIDTMYRGGAQRVMNNLITYLDSNGWDVILCNDFVQDPAILQYDVPAGVKRFYLAESIEGNAILKNIKRVFNLRGIIKEENPDCVVSFLGRPNLRMLVATVGMPVKKIVSVRNDPPKEYGSPIRMTLARWLFRLADGCVFQTVDAKAYFPESVQLKSEVILNPVDERFYKDSPRRNVSDVVTFGRLMTQKNHKMLLESFARIAKQVPDQKLIIYGEGPLREELEKLAKVLEIDTQVFFPGNVERVEEYLAKAKVFVLSSDYEGMPNALMEAMAAGVACVATDCPCGGPKALIQDGINGFLVPVGDTVCMAEKISTLLADENLRKQMSSKAHKSAEDFSSMVILEIWEKYILKVCN